MREKFILLIKREIKNAVEGKKAEIIAKMNSLVDPEIIKLLFTIITFVYMVLKSMLL